MATHVLLPKLGQTMEEGTIVEWLKQEGDIVSRGDVLFTVETDKAVLEVEARNKGVLRKILIEKGVKLPVGTPVAIIGTPDENIDDLLAGQPERPLAEEAQPAAQAGYPVGDDRPTVRAAEGEVLEDAPVEVESPPRGQIQEDLRMGRIFASPRARRLAQERGIDLGLLTGSGPEGRIVERDVLGHLASQPAATPLAQRVAQTQGVPLERVQPEDERIRAEDVRRWSAAQPTVEARRPAEAPTAIKAAAEAPAARPQPQARPTPRPAPTQEREEVVMPFSGVRALIAERMAGSAHTAAAVTLNSVADATELVALRERLKDAYADELGFSIGYNDLLAVISARALTDLPYMNARLEEQGIRQLAEVNIGMAVDSDRGLLVPVIRDADRLGVAGLAQRLRELVGRAREGKATLDDLTGGTFTITNLGMFGVDMFTPIINLPETAILGVGRIRPEPVVQNGEVTVRQQMWLSLTFDHRLVDGAPAARFLQRLVRYVESPYLLLG